MSTCPNVQTIHIIHQFSETTTIWQSPFPSFPNHFQLSGASGLSDLEFPQFLQGSLGHLLCFVTLPRAQQRLGHRKRMRKKKTDNLDNMMQRHRYSCRMPGFRTHAKLTLCSICRESIPGSNSLQNAGLRELQHGNQHDKTTSYIKKKKLGRQVVDLKKWTDRLGDLKNSINS